MKSSCITAGILLTFLVSPGTAAEPAPEVSFEVDADEWVQITLTRDSKPVAGAKVVVTMEPGGKFADGELGVKGTGEFPLPPTKRFKVEIKIDDRTSDPIMLTKVDKIVVPTNVLVTFGLAPCCRAPVATAAEKKVIDEDASKREYFPDWLRATLSITLGAAGLAIIILRPRSER